MNRASNTSHRILLYTENNVIGGVDTFITTLVNNWPNAQDEFTVMCNEDHVGYQRLKTKLEKNNNHLSSHNFNQFYKFSRAKLDSTNLRIQHKLLVSIFIILRYLNFLYLILKMSRFFKRLDHDYLIVVNGGYPGGDSCRAATIAWRRAHKSRPGIHSFHNFVAISPGFLKLIENQIDKSIDKSVSAWVTVSNSCLESMSLRKYLAKSEKKTFIYNGIDNPLSVTEAQIDKFREALSFEKQDQLILMLASYETRKGHKLAIDAVSLVIKEIPRIKLLMCGSGTDSEISTVKDSIKSAGMTKNVIALSYQDDVQVLLASSQLLVVPSQYEESFGLVIVEAMSNHVPVVATSIGGIPEVIEDGVSGMLCQPNNPQEMANHIIKVLTDKQSNRNLSENGFNRYKQMFTADQMAYAYFKLINS